MQYKLVVKWQVGSSYLNLFSGKAHHYVCGWYQWTVVCYPDSQASFLNWWSFISNMYYIPVCMHLFYLCNLVGNNPHFWGPLILRVLELIWKRILNIIIVYRFCIVPCIKCKKITLKYFMKPLDIHITKHLVYISWLFYIKFISILTLFYFYVWSAIVPHN